MGKIERKIAQQMKQKQYTKCVKCGALKISRSDYCKPCSDIVKQEYLFNYYKQKRKNIKN
jgi:uncharacterized OB-fold protein